MRKRNRGRFLKRLFALGCSVAADFFCSRYARESRLRFCLLPGMILLFILCFSVYRDIDSENALKLAYILFGTSFGEYFSLECVFLMLFEIVMRKVKGGE